MFPRLFRYLNHSIALIAMYAIPAPINGPTATPLNKETAKMVPNTSAVVIWGSDDSKLTPPLASSATAIPDKRAIHAKGDLKAAERSRKPISPVAMGASTAIVIMVTPN